MFILQLILRMKFILDLKRIISRLK